MMLFSLTKMLNKFREGLHLHVNKQKIPLLPFTMAHISDLHFDGTGKLPKWVRQSVYNYTKDNPIEILCVTGDIVDKGDQYAYDALEWLNSLPVNYVIVSLGNHDKDAVEYLIKYSINNTPKIKVFINKAFAYQDVNFICSADKGDKKYYPQTIKHLPSLCIPQSINIILAHNPNSFLDFCSSLPNHISNLYVLSGHTHGGQVAYADFIRNLFKRFIQKEKLLCKLKINREHDCFKLQGKVKKKGNTLFINNGLGYHAPGRFFCPPMLTIFEPND